MNNIVHWPTVLAETEAEWGDEEDTRARVREHLDRLAVPASSRLRSSRRKGFVNALVIMSLAVALGVMVVAGVTIALGGETIGDKFERIDETDCWRGVWNINGQPFDQIWCAQDTKGSMKLVAETPVGHAFGMYEGQYTSCAIVQRIATGGSSERIGNYIFDFLR